MTNRFSLIAASILTFFAALTSAHATIDIDLSGELPAKFAIDKTICAVDPFTLSPPQSCELAPIVSTGMPVYYLFTLNNPWGEPVQLVTLKDPLPSGFTASGPLVCKDFSGAGIAVMPASGALGKVYLGLEETLSCVLPGSFNAPGSKNNTVTAINQTGYSIEADVNTTVLPATPMGVDLSVSKSANPGAVDVTNGAQNVSYTIVVENQSPTAVDAGNYFKLHDKMALLPNSVPLRVEYLNSSCIATTGTDCLDTAAPFIYHAPETLVGTMGQTNFLRFAFPTGSQGHIEPGGKITLTINAKVRWLPGLSCQIDASANGIRNTAFFTLIDDAGSAMVDSNWQNNTDIADLKVTSGNKTIDANCGKGHLKVEKEQVSPAPSTKAAWGQQITYEIALKNVSLPAQPLQLNSGDIQDWVTEGLNTPPFTREHLNTICLTSSNPSFCSAFDNSILADPAFKYEYYTQTNRAWNAGGTSLVLQPGETATIQTKFKYVDPDCETVPAAPEKPIINTARLSYFATEYGALSASDPKIGFLATDSAITKMEDQPACKFVVTKKSTDMSPFHFVLFFNKPVNYQVTFENNGGAREIGSVIDRMRLSHDDYAEDWPYESHWTCSDNGKVSGYKSSGNISGVLNYTSTPAQGSDAIDFRSNPAQALYFNTGGKLTCQVRVTVKRPELNSALCTSEPRRLQNIAMMDVSYPFNGSIHWPPSGAYNPSAFSNPAQQNKNWAMTEHKLPLCQDMQLNKSASVDGLPGNSLNWTYEGGPEIDYTLTYTNLTKSSITGSGNANSWNSLAIKDEFKAPYGGVNTAGDSCAPSSTCQVMNGASGRKLGIDDMTQGQSAAWTFRATGPFIKGEDIENCAIIEELGLSDPNSHLMYQNYARPVSMTSPSNQRSCVKVPVIDLTKINVTKLIQDNTGANITTGGPFEFKVSCSPYDLFLGGETVTINAGQTGTIKNVPVRSDCRIEETSLPPVPQAAMDACGIAPGVPGQAFWGDVSYSPSDTFNHNLSSGGINVVATNSLECKSPEYSPLKINKIFRQGQKDDWNFKFNVNCSPFPANPVSVAMSYPDEQSVVVDVPVGSTCTVEEILPNTFPADVINYCAGLKWHGMAMVPVWQAPSYSSSNPFIASGSNPLVEVTNQWKCGPKLVQDHSGDVIKGGSFGTPIVLPPNGGIKIGGADVKVGPRVLLGLPDAAPDLPKLKPAIPDGNDQEVTEDKKGAAPKELKKEKKLPIWRRVGRPEEK